MDKWRRILARVAWTLLGAAILFAGFRVAKKFMDTKPEAGRASSWTKPVPVQFRELELQDEKALIHAAGTVVAARQLVLQPEVTGKLEFIHEGLTPGGIVKAGERLVKIADRDYELVVQARKADIADARLLIHTEKRRQAVAEREWKLLDSEIDVEPEGKALSLREPHLAAGRARLEATKSALATARLNLERTEIHAPFNAMVVEETVEIGLLVNPSSRLATLVGTDSYWVEVSVPFSELPLIRIPGVNGTDGAKATIRLQGAQDSVAVREGHVIRLLPTVTQAGRMARLLVEVRDPLQLERPAAERDLPLVLQSYVRVDIEGRVIRGAASIPVAALHEDGEIHVADNAMVVTAHVTDVEGPFAHAVFRFAPVGFRYTITVPDVLSSPLSEFRDVLAQLTLLDVSVAHRGADHVLVRAKEGIELQGRRLITSRVAAPLPGMWLRPRGPDGKPSAGSTLVMREPKAAPAAEAEATP